MDVHFFSKGSLYWYNNPNTSKSDYGDESKNQDFMTNRPVIILSEWKDTDISLTTVLCCPCTSKITRSGIQFIGFDSRREKLQVSTAMPYAVRSVGIEFLDNYQGQVDYKIVQRILQAVQYHLGLSDEVPEYSTIPKYISTHGFVASRPITDRLGPNCKKPAVWTKPSPAIYTEKVSINSAAKIGVHANTVQQEPAIINTSSSTDTTDDNGEKEAAIVNQLEIQKSLQSSVSPLPIRKLQSEVRSFSFRKTTLQKIEKVGYDKSIEIIKANNNSLVAKTYGVSYNVATKILQFLKVKFELDKKNFIEYAKQDSHKLKYISGKNLVVFKYVTDDDIINNSAPGKYSATYLGLIRRRCYGEPESSK